MTNQLCRNVIEAKHFFINNRDFKTLVLAKKKLKTINHDEINNVIYGFIQTKYVIKQV